MDKYVGKRLDGRYEIKELIGVGGMAYVYKAYDNIDDRVVAIKILREEFLSNEDFTRRFKNESKAIAILSHPNIVKVYDVSFGERLQYIVMEYIDGITLKEYIDQQKDIKWKEAVHFTVQILRALQHAHDKGIVHRDIKPQNIILLPDGTIKVTDFGIARFSRTDVRATNATEKAIGSVHYISPEQARGEITDEKADIYSVGVMLYEMLTGRLPFEADNAVSVAIMQLQSEPKRPREINPQIPEGLEDITIKAMQKDPAKRYQSAAEMQYDIDEFKRNPSIHFEYKYFVDETPTRFVEAITKVKNENLRADEGNDEDEYDDDENEKKGVPIIPILAAIAGAFVLVALIFVGVIFVMKLTNTNPTENVSVPTFEGKNFAEEIFTNAEYNENFKFDYEPERYDPTVPKGYVLKQDPMPGKSVKKGSTVRLTLSKGPKMTILRDVTGEESNSAITHLTADGFLVTTTPKFSDTVPKGFVVQTDPVAGTEVAEGSRVTIYVSNGPQEPDPIAVPKVVNTGRADAEAALKDNFLVEVVEENSTYEKGVVLRQEPAYGEMLAPGSTVTIYVSSGYQDVTLSVKLPNTDTRVDIEVRVEGETDKSLSKTDVVPQDMGSLKITLTQRQDSYTVTVYIAPTGTGSYEKYYTCKVYGKTGEVKDAAYSPYVEPTTPPTTTTTEQETPTTNPDPQD